MATNHNGDNPKWRQAKRNLTKTAMNWNGDKRRHKKDRLRTCTSSAWIWKAMTITRISYGGMVFSSHPGDFYVISSPAGDFLLSYNSPVGDILGLGSIARHRHQHFYEFRVDTRTRGHSMKLNKGRP